MKILSTILLVSSVMFSAVAYSSSEEDEVWGLSIASEADP